MYYAICYDRDGGISEPVAFEELRDAERYCDGMLDCLEWVSWEVEDENDNVVSWG
jgi:hypothetical protein